MTTTAKCYTMTHNNVTIKAHVKCATLEDYAAIVKTDIQRFTGSKRFAGKLKQANLVLEVVEHALSDAPRTRLQAHEVLKAFEARDFDVGLVRADVNFHTVMLSKKGVIVEVTIDLAARCVRGFMVKDSGDYTDVSSGYYVFGYDELYPLPSTHLATECTVMRAFEARVAQAREALQHTEAILKEITSIFPTL